MLQPTTTTLFAVARDLEIISDGYADVETAKRQLAHVQDTMKSVGLEPDVEIVTVEMKATIGKPKLWVDPSAVDEPEEAPADEPAEKPAAPVAP